MNTLKITFFILLCFICSFFVHIFIIKPELSYAAAMVIFLIVYYTPVIFLTVLIIYIIAVRKKYTDFLGFFNIYFAITFTSACIMGYEKFNNMDTYGGPRNYVIEKIILDVIIPSIVGAVATRYYVRRKVGTVL
jgi:hypothetical protein